MEQSEFIEFINKKSGMNLKLADAEKDLTSVEEWDSLTFVYMIIEFEHRYGITLNVEQLLSCLTLNDIMEVINNEIRKNQQ